MKAIHLIQVLYDDIVLRLWKFIDSDPRTNGGRPLIERLRQSTVVDESRLVAAEAALGRLRSSMPNLEEYRHTRVAHMAAKRPDKIKPHPPLLPAIREAVAYLDTLSGEHNDYRVGPDDLRVLVLGEVVAANRPLTNATTQERLGPEGTVVEPREFLDKPAKTAPRDTD